MNLITQSENEKPAIHEIPNDVPSWFWAEEGKVVYIIDKGTISKYELTTPYEPSTASLIGELK